MFGLCKKDTVSRKEIRADFYRCRDFELANLWQRSIFLSAFLILCFTGYGYILVKIIDTISQEPPIYNNNTIHYLHLIAICIGILSLLFSILWIMMGKGSKAWYEIYENAICKIDEEIIEEKKHRMGELYHRYGFDEKLLSGNAGPYSVSKINIGIGQVGLWLWAIVIVIHVILNTVSIIRLLIDCICNSRNVNNCSEVIISILLLIVTYMLLFTAAVLSYFFKNKWFQSGYLKKAHKD